MYFPQNLLKILSENGLSRYALAKELGCHPSTVTNWLEGATVPNRRFKLQIAERYGYDPASLDAPELRPAAPAAEDWRARLEAMDREELMELMAAALERLRRL